MGRVLLVVDSLDGGGAERHVVDLATALRARGWDVQLACSAGGVRRSGLDAAGVPVHVLHGRLVKRRLSLRYALRLRRLVRRLRPDVVHAHVYASEVAAALATVGTRVPLVVTEHTEAPWRGWTARAASRWTHRRARVTVAVSHAIRRMLLTGYAVPPERVVVVAPAVPPPVPRRGTSPAPRRDPEAPVVAFAGRLVRDKGVDVLLAAVPALLARLPRLRVLVVGEGPAGADLARLADALGVSDHVTFTGFRHDATDLIGTADVLAVPSRSDGTPQVVFEAMSRGVPVVGSAVGGLPDQVEDGRSGLLVPADDPAALAEALLRLLTRPALAREVGEHGRLRTPATGHATMVARVEEVYRGVLAAAATRSSAGSTAGTAATGRAERPASAERGTEDQNRCRTGVV